MKGRNSVGIRFEVVPHIFDDMRCLERDFNAVFRHLVDQGMTVCMEQYDLIRADTCKSVHKRLGMFFKWTIHADMHVAQVAEIFTALGNGHAVKHLAPHRIIGQRMVHDTE